MRTLDDRPMPRAVRAQFRRRRLSGGPPKGVPGLHLSVTDAMGHGVGSALLATLLVGSMRNSRRAGLTLRDTARVANTAVSEHAPGGQGFVTGLLLRLDLTSGRADVVNAGHVPPYLLRDRSVRRVDLPPDIPFGMLSDQDYQVSTLELQPG